ncbi:MAG: bifunctional oligoribonuclease/PAP phosphatase NrnA [Candidatus Krumholzibacteriota bacterium]|nr:bifunctional oligoribonuclease/PAP phosphatase NrnA [Candidatus Krumholzibacteriota bacterium]
MISYKDMQLFENIRTLINQHKTFILIAHIDPDGDCVGSMLSFAALLENMGKEVGCYIPGGVSGKYKKFPRLESILSEEDVKGFQFEAAFVFDTPTLGRAGDIITPEGDAVIVNIDHHPTNRRFGSINYIKDKTASTTILVYHFLSFTGSESITPEIADYLYLGIVMDTGCFRFQNTDAEALSVASELIKYGARASEITREFFYMKKFRSVKLLSCVLANLQLFEDGKIAVMTLTNSMLDEFNAEAEDTEGFIDYASSIEGVELAAFLREINPERVRASLRSLDDLDVASLAERYGGGGHKNAAGLTLEYDLERSRELIINGFRQILIKL